LSCGRGSKIFKSSGKINGCKSLSEANEKTYSFNNAERALGGCFGWLFVNTCQIAGAI
jgi:hypothetical protein